MKRLEQVGLVGPGENQWNLAFVPISMRFGTNAPQVFYEILAGRLAQITGPAPKAETDDADPKAYFPTDPEAYYHARCRVLLDQGIEAAKRILVVVDGVDEALGGRFDTDWFPIRPGDRLRVLISARLQEGDENAAGWKKRLGWRTGVRVESHDLWVLDDLREIIDLLQRSGVPATVLASHPALAGRLLELSRGEPLVLRLYVEDILSGKTEGGLSIEDLDRLKPGLEEYFEDWIERQREAWNRERKEGAIIHEEDLAALLSVLSCAYGPLTAEQLGDLARRAHGIALGLRVENALRPIRRFVMGVPESYRDTPEIGYILSHPMFRDFLQQHFRSGIDRMSQTFASWGRDIVTQLNAGNLPPPLVPSYLLRYLGQHFEDVGASAADFMALVEEGWFRAWYLLEGTHSGFSQYVAQALRHLAKMDAHNNSVLTWKLRCRLVESSIASVGARLPHALFVACVRYDLISPAEALHLLNYQGERWGDVLSVLAPKLSVRLLEKALEMVLSRGHWGRGDELAALAPHLAEPALTTALEAARRIGEADGRARALTALGVRTAEPARTAILREAMAAIREEMFFRARAEAFERLMPHLSATMLDEALEVATGNHFQWERDAALAALAPYLSNALRAKAVRAARKLEDDGVRARTLTAFVPFVSRATRGFVTKEVLQATRKIEGALARLGALLALAQAPKVSKPERSTLLEEALQVAVKLRGWDLVAALSSLAPHLPEPRLADMREKALLTILSDERDVIPQRESSRLAHLTAFAAGLAEPDRTNVLSVGLRLVTKNEDEETRAQLLAMLAPDLTEPLLRTALQSAQELGGKYGALALATVASNLPDPERLDVLSEAFRSAVRINDGFLRSLALVAVAVHLPEAERASVLEEALAAARPSGQIFYCPRALGATALAAHQSPADGAESIAACLTMWWESVAAEEARATALSTVVVHVDGDKRARLFGEVLEAAQKVRDEVARGRLFASILPNLVASERATVIEVVLKIPDEAARATVLAILVPRLSEVERASVAEDALKFVDEKMRAAALAAISPYLRGEALAAVVDASIKITDEALRAEILGRVLPQLQESERASVVEAAQSIVDKTTRTVLLATLAASLPAPLRDGLSPVARQISDAVRRTKALAMLAPHLPEPERADALGEAIESTKQLFRAFPSFNASDGALFMEIVPNLPEAARADMIRELLPRLFNDYSSVLPLAHMARLVDVMLGHMRWVALPVLLPLLPEADRALVLGKLLAAAKSLEKSNDTTCAQALATLAPHLSVAQLADAQQLVDDKITGEGPRAAALAVLAPRMPQELRDGALRSVLAKRFVLRESLLAIVPHYLSVIARHEGHNGIREVRRTIEAVSRWFP
jgi:hypothetical protein